MKLAEFNLLLSLLIKSHSDFSLNKTIQNRWVSERLFTFTHSYLLLIKKNIYFAIVHYIIADIPLSVSFEKKSLIIQFWYSFMKTLSRQHYDSILSNFY